MAKQRFGILLFSILTIFGAAVFAHAQFVDTGQPVPVLSANQLDDLVAPIALYPDSLLSEVLVASTYPLEIVETNQWLQRNPGLSGPALVQAAEQQNWDPSVQALVVFPEVVQRLSSDVQWTTDLGNAFLSQEGEVMNAVQRVRNRAEQTGALSSNSQVRVNSVYDGGQSVIVIVPSDPDVIYVPDYDPYWFWGTPVYYRYPRWHYPPRPSNGFVVYNSGIHFGLFFGSNWRSSAGWGWRPSWGSRTVVVNNTFINQYHFNSNRGTRSSGTVVWSHDASHRRGVPYPNRDLTQRFRATTPQNARPQPAFSQSSPAAQRQRLDASRNRAAAPSPRAVSPQANERPLNARPQPATASSAPTAQRPEASRQRGTGVPAERRDAPNSGNRNPVAASQRNNQAQPRPDQGSRAGRPGPDARPSPATPRQAPPQQHAAPAPPAAPHSAAPQGESHGRGSESRGRDSHDDHHDNKK